MSKDALDSVESQQPRAVNDRSSEVSANSWNDMKTVLGPSAKSSLSEKGDQTQISFDYSMYGDGQNSFSPPAGGDSTFQSKPFTLESTYNRKVDPERSVTLERGNSRAENTAREMDGVRVDDPRLEKLDQKGIKSTERVLIDDKASQTDRLRAGNVLYDHGVDHVKTGTGAEYMITKDSVKGQPDGDKYLKIQTKQTDGSVTDVAHGSVNTKGEVIKLGTSKTDTRGLDKVVDNKESDKKEADQPYSGKPIFDPKLTNEQKLLEADKMFQRGEKSFVGPDGKKYEINETTVGGRKLISIHTQDDSGNSKPVLRGVIEKDGSVSKQRDTKGREVDLESNWAKQHGQESALLKKEPLPKPDQGDKLPKPNPDGGEKLPEPDEKTPNPDGGGEKNPDGSDKRPEISEEQKRLESERERLKANAEKLEPPEAREQFVRDMERFEARVKAENRSPAEVTESYKQMSRLLEAENGAVGSKERQLAAKSFMSHAADPTNIDQGAHNTCNVTTLAERTMTRTPSKMAEMVATAAIDGKWTASDGKVITLKPESLQPGREERTFPPSNSGDRTYATQLMNVVAVNDVLQRRMPPEYYSQQRPTATNRTGETATYADGSAVGDGKYKGVYCDEFTAVGKRLNGEDKFAIVNSGLRAGDGVLQVGKPEDLRNTLQEMKDQGRLPAIVQVDSNDPLFGGTGNPATKGQWHVVTVTGYDAATGKVQISNQWGKHRDITGNVDDLYRSTRT